MQKAANKKARVRGEADGGPVVTEGNVFAVLDLPNAEELDAKASLVLKISEVIKENRWKQAQAAERLGIERADVSRLLHGHLSRFSRENLEHMLRRASYDVEIVIRHRMKGGIGSLRVVEGDCVPA